MRKTIYVKDEGVWNDVLAKAKDGGYSSVSQYLLAGCVVGSSQLDRIEEKLDLLFGDRPPGEKISRGDMVSRERPIVHDEEAVKAAKLAKLRSTGHFNPQPKGKK